MKPKVQEMMNCITKGKTAETPTQTSQLLDTTELTLNLLRETISNLEDLAMNITGPYPVPSNDTPPEEPGILAKVFWMNNEQRNLIDRAKVAINAIRSVI